MEQIRSLVNSYKMTLRERWQARETSIGKFLKNQITGLLLICSILGGANEYLALVPPDFVPVYIKTIVVVAGVVSYVSGKMTVKKNESNSKIL